MKKLLTVLLAAVMVLGCLPVFGEETGDAGFAAEAAPVSETAVPDGTEGTVSGSVPDPQSDTAFEAEENSEPDRNVVPGTEAPALPDTDPVVVTDVTIKAVEGDILTKQNFPDTAFLAALQKLYPNGLTAGDAAKVKKLDVNRKEIKDLTGVRFFTGLEYLYCSGNQLTELDVSGLSALWYLFCDQNQLTGLNVSGCTAIDTLSCTGNRLTTLDISDLTDLGTLYCEENQLTELDLSGYSALRQLYCMYNQLTKLDISGCTDLMEVICHSNPMVSLKAVGCRELYSLSCENNRLTSLDLSGCIKLDALFCENNRLTSLDLSDCANLEGLYCKKNSLATLELSGKKKLLYLEADQVCTVAPISDGGKYAADLTTLVGSGNLERVRVSGLPKGASYDAQSGIVRGITSGFSYQYDTNCPVSKLKYMTVSVKLDLKPLTSVALSVTGTQQLNIGDTLQLSAILKDEGVQAGLTWSSSASGVASVSGGTVTAKAEGTAVIKVTAACGKVKKTATVRVKVVDPQKPTKVILSETGTVSLDLGKTLKLTTTLEPETATGTVTWKSSSAKIAQVDAEGVVTPVKEGIATVTATVKYKKVTKSAKVKIKVVDPLKPTSVTLSAAGTVILPNTQVLTLSAAVLPSTADQKVEWMLSKAGTGCAALEGGVLRPIEGKTGTAEVTAAAVYGKVKKTAKVKVLIVDPARVARVTLQGAAKLGKGETMILTALIEPLTVEKETCAITWKSSAPKIVSVSAEGEIRGLKKGNATVTVTVTQGSGKTAVKKSAKLKIKVVP